MEKIFIIGMLLICAYVFITFFQLHKRKSEENSKLFTSKKNENHTFSPTKEFSCNLEIITTPEQFDNLIEFMNDEKIEFKI